MKQSAKEYFVKAFLRRHQSTMRDRVNQTRGTMLGIDPEVITLREEYRMLFGQQYAPYLKGLVHQCVAIAEVAKTLGENDFMKKTGHGSRALAAANKLGERIDKTGETLMALIALEKDLDKVRSMADLERFKEFSNSVQQQIAEARPEAEEVAGQLEVAIEFNAIKAIVMTDGKFDKTELGIDVAFGAVNGLLSIIVTLGTATGVVPSPYTKPVTLAVNTTARVLRLGLALTKRQVVAKHNSNKVEEYSKTHSAQEVWDKHTEDQTIMAQRLAIKFKTNVDIALVCADIPMGVVADLLTTFASDPGIASFVWDQARQVVQAAAYSYADAKVDKLAKDLNGVIERTAKEMLKAELKKTGEVFLDELKGQVLSDLTNVLNPISLLGHAVLNTAIDRVVEKFVSALPIDPAQAVNGAQLQAAMAEIADAVATGMPARDEALAGRMEAEERASRTGNWVPAKDADGNAVDMVLGEIASDEKGSYRRVKIGADVGKLYHDDLQFAKEEQDEIDKLILPLVPKYDSLGRNVDEIDFGTGINPKNGYEAPGDLQGNHLWARVGRVWGYIDTTTLKFYPKDVHKTAFGLWHQRKLDKRGYFESGQLVEGKWYQPFAHLPTYYMFDGPLGQEWAKAGDETGSGTGNANTIVNVLTKEGVKIHTSFDLDELR